MPSHNFYFGKGDGSPLHKEINDWFREHGNTYDIWRYVTRWSCGGGPTVGSNSDNKALHYEILNDEFAIEFSLRFSNDLITYDQFKKIIFNHHYG